ncbi:unnamed protein product, partial [Scytosiphon promiscuus]
GEKRRAILRLGEAAPAALSGSLLASVRWMGERVALFARSAGCAVAATAAAAAGLLMVVVGGGGGSSPPPPFVRGPKHARTESRRSGMRDTLRPFSPLRVLDFHTCIAIRRRRVRVVRRGLRRMAGCVLGENVFLLV